VKKYSAEATLVKQQLIDQNTQHQAATQKLEAELTNLTQHFNEKTREIASLREKSQGDIKNLNDTLDKERTRHQQFQQACTKQEAQLMQQTKMDEIRRGELEAEKRMHQILAFQRSQEAQEAIRTLNLDNQRLKGGAILSPPYSSSPARRPSFSSAVISPSSSAMPDPVFPCNAPVLPSSMLSPGPGDLPLMTARYKNGNSPDS
jgi:hypothetical protein